MTYFVYYESNVPYEYFYGIEVLGSREEAENFINKHPDFIYKVIMGREIMIKPVTHITKLELQS